MEWRDFSCLISSFSHTCLQFSVIFFLAFLLSFFLSSCNFPLSPLIIKMFRGHSAAMPIQTGGPKPLRFFFYLFTGLHFYLTFSLLSLPFSLFSSVSLYYCPPLSLCITQLFGSQHHAGSHCSICTVHLDGIVC